MNPISVNSANIVQFGFSATFDLENALLKFDIAGLTIFQPGGQNNTQGINFQVIDPSGAEISRIDFPNKDIDPATSATYQVPLSNAPSQFGYYRIKGVIREANGQDYVIEISPKNICKPKDWKKGTVPGVFSHEVDCSVPRLTVMENTNLTYQNLAPLTIVKDGRLYYPQGTLPEQTFTFTPFEIFGSGQIYTGDYTVRNKTIATYDMGELIYVQVTFATTYKFSVNCNSNLCEVICCMEKMQSIVKNDCNSPQGKEAQRKLDEVTIPLIMAMTLEKCGKDASDLVEQIAKTLGCDCNCDDAEAVEPRPIYTLFDPVVLAGQCATQATLSAGVWNVKTKFVEVVAATGTSTALSITSSENDCTITYQVAINETLLIQNQLTLIKNSPELSALFNSLIKTQTLDFSEIGENCIYNVTDCDFNLIEDASNAAKQVINIVIGGTTYPAPAALSITNALGISNWLNALNRGVFQVYYDTTTNPDTTVINSLNNPNVIATMVFSTGGVQEVKQFSRNCGSIIELFKAIITYLCALDTSKVKLARAYSICAITASGTVSTTTISPSDTTNLDTFLVQLLQSYCSTLTNLLAAQSVNCTTVQAVFTNTANTITQNDVLYGTRGKAAPNVPNTPGACGIWRPQDMANWLLDFLLTTNDQAILDKFCQVKDRCFQATCNPVTYATVELIEPCPSITNISGTFTN